MKICFALIVAAVALASACGGNTSSAPGPGTGGNGSGGSGTGGGGSGGNGSGGNSSGTDGNVPEASGTDANGMCSLTATSKMTVTVITKADGSSASCVELSVASFNALLTGACGPKISSDGCSAMIGCVVGEAYVGGTIMASGSTFMGSISVMPPPRGPQEICRYSLSGTVL